MIRIIAIGRVKDRRLADLMADYERRLRPLTRLQTVELRDQTPDREARQILDKLGSPGGGELVVALDERGEARPSTGVADLLGAHGSIAFVIGGADGLTDEVRRRADVVLQLSSLTLTHEWARALLIEQIYRGLTILRGMPYHRG